MEKRVLALAGMTDNETEIYTILLSLKKATASDIASKANISRPHVYDSIQRLIEKGLASYFIQSGRKQFIASDPSKLLDYMNEQEAKLKEKKEKIKQILPELEKLKEKEETGPVIEIFEGKEGLKTVFSDIIKTGKEYFVINAGNEWMDYHPDVVEWFEKEKKRCKVKAKCIISMNRKIIIPGDIYKKVPEEQYGPSTTMIYGNKVLFLLGRKNITAVLAESRDLAETYKNQFDTRWNQNTTVFKGFEGMKNVFNKMLSELKENESYYVIGSNKQALLMENWFADFHSRRIKKKVKVFMLTHNDFYEDAIDIFRKAGEKDFSMTFVKSLPPEIENPVQINLYNNKVHFVLWKESTIIQIESKNLYNSLRDYFDTLWNQDVRVFHGLDGIKYLLNDTLNYKEVKFIAAGGYLEKRMPSYFFNVYIPKARKLGIKWKQLAQEKTRNMRMMKLDMMELKFIEEGEYGPNVVWIYGNKVVNVLWKKEPIAFMIDNEEIADGYRKYFELMWARKT